MKHLRMDRTDINLPLLDQTLRSQLNDAYLGISLSDEQLRVHLSDRADADVFADVRQLVEAHDATALTDAQRAVQERKANLKAARTEDMPITPDELQSESPLLQKMVRKLRRLELEIEALRSE